MNKVLLGGYFKKVSYKEGGNFLLKVGIKRDFKNKETGKYEYDNVTCYISKRNEALIKFVNSYVKDNDYVEIEAHFATYTTESEGVKKYHEDVIVDTLRTAGNKGTAKSDTDESAETSAETTFVKPEEIEVSNGDMPF